MSAKNCDTHNRFRDKTIAFRVSSEEDKHCCRAFRNDKAGLHYIQVA